MAYNKTLIYLNKLNVACVQLLKIRIPIFRNILFVTQTEKNYRKFRAATTSKQLTRTSNFVVFIKNSVEGATKLFHVRANVSK